MRPVTLRVFALACLAAGAIGCASAPKPAPVAPAPKATDVAPGATVPEPAATAPNAPSSPDSGLRFAVEPAEAEIAVDGRPFGTVAALDAQGGILNLAPGIYQVSLKAAGYVTWRAEVALHAGTETIKVKLAKKP